MKNTTYCEAIVEIAQTEVQKAIKNAYSIRTGRKWWHIVVELTFESAMATYHTAYGVYPKNAKSFFDKETKGYDKMNCFDFVFLLENTYVKFFSTFNPITELLKE